jgi:hypothetical protein
MLESLHSQLSCGERALITHPFVCMQNGLAVSQCVIRVGQNVIHTPYVTVYLVIFLPKVMYNTANNTVLANPDYVQRCVTGWRCVKYL